MPSGAPSYRKGPSRSADCCCPFEVAFTCTKRRCGPRVPWICSSAAGPRLRKTAIVMTYLNEPAWSVCEIACISVALGALFSVAAGATGATAMIDTSASRTDRCIACTTLQRVGRMRCRQCRPPVGWCRCLFGHEPDRRERRQRQGRRERLVVPPHRLGLDAAEVPDPGTAVERRVGVQHLPPATAQGHADAIVVARHRREVEDAHERPLGGIVEPRKREHVVRGIVRLEPPKPAGVEV